MKNSKVELNPIIAELQKALSRELVSVKVAALDDSCDEGEAGSAYFYLHVFNVPECRIVAQENFAYSVVNRVRPRGMAVCLYLHTPEETALEYPDFAERDVSPLVVDTYEIWGLPDESASITDLPYLTPVDSRPLKQLRTADAEVVADEAYALAA